jgi:hypothetical protein
MHRRADFPALDPQQQHYQIVSGLERVRLRNEKHAPSIETRVSAAVR